MRRLILGLVLLAAACSADTAQVTNTTEPVAEPTTTQATTTTTTAPATTTTEPEVVRLGYSNDLTTFPLRSDRIYLHDRSLVPVTFQFPQPGWELLIVGDDLVGFFHSTEPSVAFHLSFFPDETVDDVVTEISDRTGVETPVLEPVEFGGVDGGAFEIGPGFDPLEVASAGPCTFRVMVEDRVLDARVGTFLAPCSENEVWMAEFDPGSVALHVSDTAGTAEQPANLDRMKPLVDEFLSAFTFNP